MHKLVFLAALVSLAQPALAASPGTENGYGAADEIRDVSPQQLGELFCAARVANDMTALERYFAPKLADELGDAADAAPWQTYPDRPTACTLEIVNGYADTVGVLVRITYQAPGRTWSDTLNLERAPATWLINNVFYEGGGNLRFRLFQD